MAERPYTVLSCCMSLDGYLDGTGPRRLILSNDADLDRVDQLRADSDAILVGAATIRSDNPRLLVRDSDRRAARVERGLSPTPLKVTLTERLKLDRDVAFFTSGDVEKLVYCPTGSVDEARCQLGPVATVVAAGQPLRMRHVVDDLRRRGVTRLLVEGGGTVLTQFLTEGLADELQLAVAPFFVGDSRARRLVDDGRFTLTPDRRGRLVETRAIGDVVLLRYALTSRCT